MGILEAVAAGQAREPAAQHVESLPWAWVHLVAQAAPPEARFRCRGAQPTPARSQADRGRCILPGSNAVPRTNDGPPMHILDIMLHVKSAA